MTEFEITEDGNLILSCDHIWDGWVMNEYCPSNSTCKLCGSRRLLMPTAPRELPVRSSFSVFLADFKARFNK